MPVGDLTHLDDAALAQCACAARRRSCTSQRTRIGRSMRRRNPRRRCARLNVDVSERIGTGGGRLGRHALRVRELGEGERRNLAARPSADRERPAESRRRLRREQMGGRMRARRGGGAIPVAGHRAAPAVDVRTRRQGQLRGAGACGAPRHSVAACGHHQPAQPAWHRQLLRGAPCAYRQRRRERSRAVDALFRGRRGTRVHTRPRARDRARARASRRACSRFRRRFCASAVRGSAAASRSSGSSIRSKSTPARFARASAGRRRTRSRPGSPRRSARSAPL